jgi:hypothetical protein
VALGSFLFDPSKFRDVAACVRIHEQAHIDLDSGACDPDKYLSILRTKPGLTPQREECRAVARANSVKCYKEAALRARQIILRTKVVDKATTNVMKETMELLRVAEGFLADEQKVVRECRATFPELFANYDEDNAVSEYDDPTRGDQPGGVAPGKQ